MRLRRADGLSLAAGAVTARTRTVRSPAGLRVAGEAGSEARRLGRGGRRAGPEGLPTDVDELAATLGRPSPQRSVGDRNLQPGRHRRRLFPDVSPAAPSERRVPTKPRASLRPETASSSSVANVRLRHWLIGYARVSKTDGFQSLDLQRDVLGTAGVDAANVYHHLGSGGRDDRPGSTELPARPVEG